MPRDIAVIDSGINPDHFHVGTVSGGHGYALNAAGGVEMNDSFEDEIGHGTAIAGILKQKAPQVGLYGIKIFRDRLAAPAAILIAALEWAIAEQFKVVHLSLGIIVEAYRQQLASLCAKAHDRGIIIIAAARGPQDVVCPAAFDSVMGVSWDRNCAQDQISHRPGARIEFGAHGWPRELPGLPQEKNFRGHSFAAAHVTGMVARMVAQDPMAGPIIVRNELCRLAVQHRPHLN